MTLTRVNSNGITDGTIADADVSASAAIDKTKISGTAITAADTGTVTSAMIADGQITSAKIADATIVNQDVSLTAAIEGTKISPNFGSQATTTTGTSTAASFIPTSSSVPANGVYLPGANSLGLATASTERVRVTSAGLVGIGTTSPVCLVNGQIPSATSTSTEILRLTDAVYCDFKVKLDRVTTVTNSVCRINTASGNLAFETSDTERARIDSSGRLLIGTSTNRATNITGTTNNVVIESAGSWASLVLATNQNAGSAAYQTFLRSRGTTAGSTTIVQNGDGLGYLSFEGTDGSNPIPAAWISAHVDGTPGANDMPGRLVFSTCPDGSASPVERLRITSTGEIWTGPTTVQRYNNITTSLWGYDPGAGTGVMVFVNRGTAGDGTYQGVGLSKAATSWGTYSDERGKTNLAPIENGLSKVSNLRAVTGRYLEDEEHTSRSFLIAQDVQAVLPEAVDNGDPDKLTLRYTEVIPLLVAALKESKERIETLEAKVAALESA